MIVAQWNVLIRQKVAIIEQEVKFANALDSLATTFADVDQQVGRQFGPK